MHPDIQKILEMAREKDIQAVDLRFTDTRGRWHHMTFDSSRLDENLLEEGIMIDGSSIAGWKAINDSDMLLLADPSACMIDPFAVLPTMIIIGDVLEPSTRTAYSRCPRSVARRAEGFLKSSGIADTAFFGPEAEFFVFDDVRFRVSPNEACYAIDDCEGPYNSGRVLDTGNPGHRPAEKGGYSPVGPVDAGFDMRTEMLKTMARMNVKVEKHHHEVAPSQHELGIIHDTLLRTADNLQIYRYVVQNVAHGYGKTATFMPKPVMGDNGSGMHMHQSLWQDGKPCFAGPGYAELSDVALFYIGGIIRHARAINAFTNATTNSYKRLVPGYEAPVLLAYSSRNRSASCRVPFAASPAGKRIEIRFPDPSANPYLACAAMLMAGLDGIRNRIHPGDPIDKNLYDLPPEEQRDVPHVAASLAEALAELDQDRAFLKAGDVFTDDLIDAYIELKTEEVDRLEHTPHPVEFAMYYSC